MHSAFSSLHKVTLRLFSRSSCRWSSSCCVFASRPVFSAHTSLLYPPHTLLLPLWTALDHFLPPNPASNSCPGPQGPQGQPQVYEAISTPPSERTSFLLIIIIIRTLDNTVVSLPHTTTTTITIPPYHHSSHNPQSRVILSLCTLLNPTFSRPACQPALCLPTTRRSQGHTYNTLPSRPPRNPSSRYTRPPSLVPSFAGTLLPRCAHPTVYCDNRSSHPTVRLPAIIVRSCPDTIDKYRCLLAEKPQQPDSWIAFPRPEPHHVRV